MRLRKRENEAPEAGSPGDAGAQGIDLTRLRESVGGMLDAGNAAIERALSADSESFLRASRQQGGE